jgi:transcription elongation GreA/GreB family factor
MQLPYRAPGKYSLTEMDHLMTQGKFDSYEQELKDLYARRPAAAREVARLAELGDFSENVEYQLAKRKLRGINGGITKTEYKLNHAIMIKAEGDGSTVEIGRTVIVTDGTKERTYTILGSQQTDPSNGIISQTSPIGVALLGARLGEEVVVYAGNKNSTLKVLSIE